MVISLFAPLCLLTSCKEEKVSIQKPDNLETHSQPMPTGGVVVDDRFGKEVWFAYGSINGEGDTSANGVLQAHYFEDGSYAQEMQLNIQRPEDGSFFEAWLINPDTGDLISAGHLHTMFGDVRHANQFTSDIDYRSYTIVHVTKELDDGDPKPSDILVAKGTLKPVER